MARIILVILWTLFATGALSQSLLQETISHRDFDFTRYPNITSFSDEQTQPFTLGTRTAIYYSQIFGSLKSSVKGNLTQIRYISSNDASFEFQIWNKSGNNFTLKDTIQANPDASSSINVLTISPQNTKEIEAGDYFGMWISWQYPVGTLRLNNQAADDSDFLITYSTSERDGYSSNIKPQDAPSIPGATLEVQASAQSRDSLAYMVAVEVTVEYHVDEQPDPTTTTTTTTTTTIPTTTADTTTKDIITPSATIAVSTTSEALTTTTKDPEDKETTVDETTSKSTTKVTANSPTSVNDTSVTQKTKDVEFILSEDMLYVVIIVPIVVFILLAIIITAVLCVWRKQKHMQKIAELKKSYLTSGGSPSYPGSDMVQDYEISDGHLYPQPMSNTAYQPDSMTSSK